MAFLLALVTAGAAQAIETSGATGGGWGPDPDILTVSDLQAGGSLLSDEGAFRFSDFSFTAIGFDDAAFEQFYVQPIGQGFRLILGFGTLFGPGSLEMTYTVVPTSPVGIDGAAIPRIGLLDEIGADPVASVSWDASNGATMGGMATDFFGFPGVSVDFDPEPSLVVDQIVGLTGGSGVVKVENTYRVTKLPEPGSGLLLGAGLIAALTAPRRASGTRGGRSRARGPGGRSSAA